MYITLSILRMNIVKKYALYCMGIVWETAPVKQVPSKESYKKIMVYSGTMVFGI